MKTLRDLAKAEEEYIIKTRRHLHAHPELSEQERETTRFIIDELSSLGIPVRTFSGITGCMAVIEGELPGKTVMLRADIDALPITEPQDKPYCSGSTGVMHACGHDCHTSMLLGAARILWNMRSEIRGEIRLLFQMGEEIGRKSEEYVKRGALEGVDAVFGMHVWPTVGAGRVSFDKGERMACSDRFTITVKGTAAHGSAPHQGNDAIVAAASVVMALQTIVSRRNDPLNALVISVGMMEGGTKENILCDQVRLVGTVRTFNREFRESAPERIGKVAECAAAALGCTTDLDYYFGPSPLINDNDALTELARAAAEKIVGKDALVASERTLGAEDFSVYMEHIPGVFGYLGIRNEKKGITAPIHHPDFDVDESVLHIGAAIYAQFALDFLSAN